MDKILTSQNLGSRRETGKLIRAGRVCVNGCPVTSPDAKLDPVRDRITVDGKPLVYERWVYYMMNKPAGVLSASRDPHAPTVVDLLPAEFQRRGLFPAGRLDRDTRGLLIITDDGAFAHRMLSPKSGVVKLYHAVLDAPVTDDDIRAFREGLVLGELHCLPASLRVLEDGPAPLAEVRVCEGKFHQVKRMFEARGKTVTSLERVQIGSLSLDRTLQPGESRKLSAQELDAVFHAPEPF